MAKFSTENALRWGFQTVWHHFGLMLAAAGTWFGIAVIIQALKTFFLGQEFKLFIVHLGDSFSQLTSIQLYENPYLIVFFVAQLVLMLIQQGLMLGMIKIGFNLYDIKHARYETLFSGFSLLFKYVVATLLYSLIASAGMILLFIPGIYLILRYWFYALIIVDTNAGIIDSFKQSAVLTEGIKWHLFGYSIIVAILLHLGYLSIIGILYIWPALQLANVYIYRSCQKNPIDLKEIAVPSSSVIK
jgi:uncharacterized membrane protein